MSNFLIHRTAVESLLVGEGLEAISMVTIHAINTAFKNLLLFLLQNGPVHRSFSDWEILKKTLSLCLPCGRPLLHLAGVQDYESSWPLPQ